MRQLLFYFICDVQELEALAMDDAGMYTADGIADFLATAPQLATLELRCVDASARHVHPYTNVG
jgi:hypothetical protein